MFKTDLTFKNFLDNEVTKTLRFNISEDEMLDLVRDDSRFDPGYLSYVIEQKDYPMMMDIVRKIIVLSYGELSSDGMTFRKSDEQAIDFLQSAAYSAFRDSLLEEPGKFEAFLIGVFPSKFGKLIRERIANGEAPQLSVVE